MQVNKRTWEEKSTGLGALKRTRTGMTTGAGMPSEVLYGSASAHPSDCSCASSVPTIDKDILCGG